MSTADQPSPPRPISNSRSLGWTNPRVGVTFETPPIDDALVLRRPRGEAFQHVREIMKERRRREQSERMATEERERRQRAEAAAREGRRARSILTPGPGARP